METVACNLCGSDDYRPVYRVPDRLFFPEEWFSVVECRRCGLGFTNPRPSYEEMGRYYPPAYYDYFVKEGAFHEQRYEREATLVQSAHKGAGKKLLDVGCANGDFPRHMRRRGWEVEGVENSASSLPISDFRVYRQEFTEIPVCVPAYDVVTAWAVLEHVHDPMAYWRKAAQVLKAGGAFIFLVTNFSSVASRCLYREDVPRHLYFFTKKCVKEYCKRTGFKLISSHYNDEIYEMLAVNWLLYYAKYRLWGRPFRWEDVRREEGLSRPAFVQAHGLRQTWSSNLRFVLHRPLYVLDRLLRRSFEGYQMVTKQYGVVTYVARKSA